MKKLMVLLVIFAFGITAPAFAAKAVLSDSELGDINAGEWSRDKGRHVVTENNLSLKDTSQQSLAAVNNGNAVDSAIAMSTNIADTNNANAINLSQTNMADIQNNRPKNTSSEVMTKIESLSISKEETITADASVVGNLDASESTGKGLFGVIAGSESSVVAGLDASANFDLSDTCSVEASEDCSKTENDSSAQAEENTLKLRDESQTLLAAVGNLNAVASGAAVQANIATNNGVTGTITQLNSAIVVSGL